MRGYIYPSRNNVYHFLFYEVIEPSSSTVYKNTDPRRVQVTGNFQSLQGKVYLAAIEAVHENPLTIFGNRTFYARFKNINLPLFEYQSDLLSRFKYQSALRCLDGFCVGSPILGDYRCTWNVVRQNPLVQEWYRANNRELPPAYSPTLNSLSRCLI